MTARRRYVMFGHSRVLGDLIHLIDHLGGVLERIVQNVPEEDRPGSPDLATRLDRFLDPELNPHRVNRGQVVDVISLDEFEPSAGEAYIVGFTGHKMHPLVQIVTDWFGADFEAMVHPHAGVTPTARVGAGSIVLAGAMVESFAHVGAHVYVNKQTIVGHDATVGDYCVIAPGARLGGHVVVERGATVGMGAIILEDRIIGEDAVVAAGAVVTSDVEPGTMVAGVPAVVKKSASQEGW